MDHLLFTAVSGATRSMQQQQIHANNLANVNTQGFRHDLEQAQTEQIQGQGYHSRFMVSATNGGVSMTPGVLQETGRSLDMGIKGNGLIALEGNNGEVYTRNGQMDINADGELTIENLPVIGDNGPIVLPPYAQVSIGDDGIIAIVPADGGNGQPMDIDRIKLVDVPAQALSKDQYGFLITAQASQPRSEDVTVVGGHLESSNVSAVSEMVASMASNRQFEVQIKMMKSAEDLANAGNKLLRNS